MLVARLEYAAGQAVLTQALEKAFGFLRESSLKNLAEGRIAIEGERVYALVQSYETQAGSEPKFEVHRKFIDIQYITGGGEVILWTPLEKMIPTAAYDPVKDVCIGKAAAGDATPVRLRPGELAVFFPSDAHAPKQALGAPGRVSKIVIKVAI